MTSAPPDRPAASPTKRGYRAAEAFVRPTPTAVHGALTGFGFDLRAAAFSLSVAAPGPAPPDAPTEAFLPEAHFPQGATRVEASAGKWSVAVGEDGVQRLRWWHGGGEQRIVVTGVKRRAGVVEGGGNGDGSTGARGEGEEDGYLEVFQRSCGVM